MPKNLLKATYLNEAKNPTKEGMWSFLFPLEGSGGFLFGLLDLRATQEDPSPLRDLFEEHLTRSAQTTGVGSHTQHRFEQMVQGINERIATSAAEPEWLLSPKDVYAIIGMAGDDAMYLTGTGDLVATFLHKTPDQRYKVFNLSRSIQTESHKPTWEKLFSVVLDGELNPGDAFLVANRELSQQIDAEDLHEVLSSLPPRSSAERIRQYFPISADISCIVLRAEEGESPASMDIHDAASSLDHLVRTRDTTTRMLESQRPRRQDWPVVARSIIKTFGKIIGASFAVAAMLLMGIIKDAFFAVGRLRHGDRKFAWGTLRGRAGERLRQAKNSVRILPRGNRRLAWTIGVFVLVLAVAIGAFSIVRSRERSRISYKALVEEVEQKRDLAQASLIYKDEEQARTLIREALALVETMPVKPSERAERQTTLRGELTALSQTLRHARSVDELTTLGSLPEGETAVLFAFDAQSAYAFTESRNVYRFDAAISSFVLLLPLPEGFGVPQRTRFDDLNGLVYVFDGYRVGRLNPPEKTFEIVPVSGLHASAKDMEYYARRVYILAPEDEQVYKHDRVGDGFGPPSGWIAARTVPLRDALSFSIDGSVWVLKADGQMVRYQNGLEESWNTPSLDPTLGSGAVLWTTEQTDYVYLVDAANARVVMIEKSSGTLTAQWEHPAFAQTRGIWEREGKIWVATSTGLHEFPLATE
ncbi:hypothetical protein HYW18_00100 [Candidatus Uhrbacteria bacterium]|nr:hypothetical protein [Candidatus Uhrbacteria bacterium]